MLPTAPERIPTSTPSSGGSSSAGGSGPKGPQSSGPPAKTGGSGAGSDVADAANGGGSFPRNPDDWTPPKGWKETPAGEKTGGRHRQWVDEEGNMRRRWDAGGREAGKERGPHWHDLDDASGGKKHIDPDS